MAIKGSVVVAASTLKTLGHMTSRLKVQTAFTPIIYSTYNRQLTLHGM